jgi:ribonucleoside-diphosphate reductase alpha chain
MVKKKPAVVPPRERRKLPQERVGITHKFRIGTEKGYLTVNCYEDGTPGEIFLKMDKQGSSVSGFCDAWAIAVSIMLQMGVSISYIVGKYRGTRFPPEGMTENKDIRIATSPVDYVVRWLEQRYGR